MIFIFKPGEGYPDSPMSLGDGLKSLEEGVESKNNTINTPTSDMALKSNNGPCSRSAFLRGWKGWGGIYV